MTEVELKKKCLYKFIKYYENEYLTILELYEAGDIPSDVFVHRLKELEWQKTYILEMFPFPYKKDDPNVSTS